MIEQISDIEFAFSFREIPAQNKWGDNPHLDQLGATSHLTTTIKIIDQEAYDWIIEHNISTTSMFKFRRKHIQFNDIEDAMAFKLVWM